MPYRPPPGVQYYTVAALCFLGGIPTCTCNSLGLFLVVSLHCCRVPAHLTTSIKPTHRTPLTLTHATFFLPFHSSLSSRLAQSQSEPSSDPLTPSSSITRIRQELHYLTQEGLQRVDFEPALRRHSSTDHALCRVVLHLFAQHKLTIHLGTGSKPTLPASIELLSRRHSNNLQQYTTLQAWLPRTASSRRLATLPREDRSDGSSKHRQSSHKNSPLANPFHFCNNPIYVCKDLHPVPSTSAHLGLAYNNQNPQPLPKLRAATTVSQLPVYKRPIRHTSRTLRRPRYLTEADRTRSRPSTRKMPRPAERLLQET
jgi:hypothetical protein